MSNGLGPDWGQLIQVQTFCKGSEEMTKIAASKKRFILRSYSLDFKLVSDHQVVPFINF